ncbi:MAG: class I SAM-dependent methyltransferase, partial [Nanoarchaeota archaeon]|nr:class I SAM-dependent methyltransferase [Nanoarchaeota archaeon]
LKIKKKFDVVISFRFIFHFKKSKRGALYQQICSVLKKDGFLLFDALNKDKVKPIRKVGGKQRYIVYDKLYTQKELIKEMENNGFKVIKLFPVIRHFWIEFFVSKLLSFIRLQKLAKKIIVIIEKINTRKPYEWVVLCQKK